REFFRPCSAPFDDASSTDAASLWQPCLRGDRKQSSLDARISWPRWRRVQRSWTGILLCLRMLLRFPTAQPGLYLPSIQKEPSTLCERKRDTAENPKR